MSKLQGLTKATVRGALWTYGAFIAGKGLVFVSTVILARLLAPDDFGLLALGLTVLNYFDALSELGVGDALIYRQEDTEVITSTAFYISMGTGLVLALIALLISPWVGVFFDEPRVVPLVQVLAIKLVFTSLGSIHSALLKKRLDFRRRFYSGIGRSFFKGGISVLLAWMGFGVWSLVWGQLGGELVATLILWWVTRWKPRRSFELKKVKQLVGYGSQMVLLNLLGMLDDNLDYLMIGRRLDTVQLGYYYLAFRMPELVIINICYVVSQAVFPAYARIQNDFQALRLGYLTTLRYVSLITVPAGIGLVVITPIFVHLFYTERWSPAIPVMQTLAIYSVVYSLVFNSGDIYKAIGRPAILNQLGMVKLMVLIPVLWIAAGFGILYVAIGHLAVMVILAIARMWIVVKVIAVQPSAIVEALRPSLIAAGIMFATTYGLYTQILNVNLIFQLTILLLVGIVVYISTLWFTDRTVFKQVAGFISV